MILSKDTSIDYMMNTETPTVSNMSEACALETVCVQRLPTSMEPYCSAESFQTNVQETLIATFEKFTGMEETTTESMLLEEFISKKVEHHPT